MKKILGVLLLLLALVLGYFLPDAAARLQDRRTEGSEQAEIEPVDLTVAASMTIGEKLQMLSDGKSTCAAVELSEGKRLNVSTAADAADKAVQVLESYGFLEQGYWTTGMLRYELPVLIVDQADNTRSFFAWRMVYSDRATNGALSMFLDDETGAVLNVDYFGEMGQDYRFLDVGFSMAYCFADLTALQMNEDAQAELMQLAIDVETNKNAAQAELEKQGLEGDAEAAESQAMAQEEIYPCLYLTEGGNTVVIPYAGGVNSFTINVPCNLQG